MLKKIEKKDLFFSECYDRIFVKLILNDYDWMNYKLEAIIPLKELILEITFEYSGFIFSTMTVNGQEYIFPSDVFSKYIKLYLGLFNEQWKANTVFYGGDIIIDLWNEAIGLCKKPEKPKGHIKSNA